MINNVCKFYVNRAVFNPEPTYQMSSPIVLKGLRMLKMLTEQMELCRDRMLSSQNVRDWMELCNRKIKLDISNNSIIKPNEIEDRKDL